MLQASNLNKKQTHYNLSTLGLTLIMFANTRAYNEGIKPVTRGVFQLG